MTALNIMFKSFIITWLVISSMFMWLGCAILGFICAFIVDYQWMTDLAPMVILTCLICITNNIIRVYRSKPAEYIESKMEKWFGKAKI